jgi:hypothetical protein
MNARWINGVRQIEIHATELLEIETSNYEIDIANEKLKNYKPQVLIKFRQISSRRK